MDIRYLIGRSRKQRAAPETLYEVDMKKVRVSKAVELFESNFDMEGKPTTFRGTIMSIWYNKDLPATKYFHILHKVTKVIYGVTKGWDWIIKK